MAKPKYIVANLSELIDILGEDTADSILSDFSCPINQDIENFLKHRATIFAKQRIAMTHLVFSLPDPRPMLLGYFTLTNKSVAVDAKSLNSNLRSRISRHGSYDDTLEKYVVPMPLIAQFGKNFTNSCNDLITGEELMSLALEKIQNVESEIGGCLTYIECEDKPELVRFYQNSKFVEFARRSIDQDETGLSGHCLIQMLKFIR